MFRFFILENKTKTLREKIIFAVCAWFAAFKHKTDKNILVDRL